MPLKGITGHDVVERLKCRKRLPIGMRGFLGPRNDRAEKSGKTSLNELRQNAGEIVVLAFSPDGKILLTASHDGTARFLDAESGTQLGPALHHPDAVLCVAFHPDGQSAVTGTRDGMVQRWSVPAPPGPAALLRSGAG